MCWVNIQKITYSARIWDFGDDEGNYIFFAASLENTGIPGFEGRILSGTKERISLAQAIPLNNWIHTAVTFNKSHVSIYINWLLVASKSCEVSPASFRKATRNWIGRSQYWFHVTFVARIVDFRFYERGLTAGELLEISKCNYKLFDMH